MSIVKNLLTTIGIHILAACAGLLLSLWWVSGFSLQVPGFIVAVLVVVLAQAALLPLVSRAASRYAPAFAGGTGLIAALLALLIAGLFPGGVSVAGFGDWVLAALILWVCSAAGALVSQRLVLRRAEHRAVGHPGAAGA